MIVIPIEYGSPAYDEAVRLRDDILRKPLNMEFTAEQLAAEYDQTHIVCYNEKEQIVGSLSLQYKEDGVVKMRQVAVAENQQRKGVGRLMVNYCEEYARRKGLNLMMLHAREVSVPFYNALNYEEYGERFEEVNIPHFKMKKIL